MTDSIGRQSQAHVELPKADVLQYPPPPCTMLLTHAIIVASAVLLSAQTAQAVAAAAQQALAACYCPATSPAGPVLVLVTSGLNPSCSGGMLCSTSFASYTRMRSLCALDTC